MNNTSPPTSIFIKFVCTIQIYHRALQAGRVENIVDPDQLISQKPTDLGQHCFLDISMFSI